MAYSFPPVPIPLQDANATIKRQLQRLLLGVSVFLDVDDLKEIGDLEVYIDQSAVINIFLSHGYFKSKNCLREVQATVEKQKPFMLTHEADESKGGGPVDEIKRELADERLQTAVFTQGRNITVWYRIADFQLISLKLIAEFTLLNTPKYAGREALPIFVPGELLREQLGFNNPVTVFASKHNPGVIGLATELKQRYEAISITESNLSELQGNASTSTASSSCDVHFLLYLNANTFLDAAGVQLAEELRNARAAKMPIVMCHENDLERDGCEFRRFFETTPQDLIDDGLYKALAFAAYPGMEHRAASLALLAKALGAKSQKLSGAAWARSSEGMAMVELAVSSSGLGASRIGRIKFCKSIGTSRPSGPNTIQYSDA